MLPAETQKVQEGQSGQQSAGKAVAAHPPRATDAFYAKLLPALEVSLHYQPLTAFLRLSFNSKEHSQDLHMRGENQLKAYPNPGAVFLHTSAEFCLRSAGKYHAWKMVEGLGYYF